MCKVVSYNAYRLHVNAMTMDIFSRYSYHSYIFDIKYITFNEIKLRGIRWKIFKENQV